MKLPPESKVIHLLKKLDIPTVEIGILVVKNRNATLQTKLNDGDIVTLIPPIGGG